MTVLLCVFCIHRLATSGLLHPPLHCLLILLLELVTLQHWAHQKSLTGIVAVCLHENTTNIRVHKTNFHVMIAGLSWQTLSNHRT